MGVKRSHPATTDADLEWLVAFFASAGSLTDNAPADFKWLAYGGDPKALRRGWRMARDEVFHVVSDRAYFLMDAEFSKDGPAHNFDSWPRTERGELCVLLWDTGCVWYVTELGHIDNAPPSRPVAEIFAEFKAREEAGTLGRHDDRFPDRHV